MNDAEAYRKGYDLGMEAGYANAWTRYANELARKNVYDWTKLFFVVFAASFTAFGALYLLTFL
jgi:hypothetical protein